MRVRTHFWHRRDLPPLCCGYLLCCLLGYHCSHIQHNNIIMEYDGAAYNDAMEGMEVEEEQQQVEENGGMEMEEHEEEDLPVTQEDAWAVIR